MNIRKKILTHLCVLPRIHDRVSLGIIQENNNSFSPDEFLNELKQHLRQNLSDVPNLCRV